MNIKEYCQKIREYKDKPMTIMQYFGVKYVVMKILILAFATFIFYNYGAKLGILCGILVGYVIGIVIADIRRAFMTTRIFELQKQITDWDKVAKIINNNKNS